MDWLNYNLLNLFMGVLAMLPAGLVGGIIHAECKSALVRRIASAVAFVVTAVVMGLLVGLAASLATLVSGLLFVSALELQMWLYFRRRQHEVAVYQSLGALAGSITAARRRS